MDDVFIEKIVRRYKTGKDYLVIAGLMFAAFVIMTAMLFFMEYISFLLPVLIVALIYGLWYMLTAQNREFEYIVTNGDLDIDLIIARRKRKRVFSGKAKNFELMAKCDSDDYRQAQKSQHTLLDCSSSSKSPNNWFILTEYKSQRTLLLFSPDERILSSLRRFNPGKIKYQPSVH